MLENDECPVVVADLARMACQAVEAVTGVAPDYAPETLPVVDEYLRRVKTELGAGELELVTAAAGCYFGEVMRRLFNARWAVVGDQPDQWRLEFERCFLHFCPVGMAGEVVEGKQTDRYDGAFGTLDDLRDGLHQALDRAAPLPEDEYYSLAGRVDVLELVAQWLLAHSTADDEPPPRYSAYDYSVVLDPSSGG